MADVIAKASDVPEPPTWVLPLDMGDEVVLFDERNGVLHALDERASLVWRCFDGVVSIDQLSIELAEGFEVEPAVVRADLLALVDHLAQNGLVVVGTEPFDP